ncbi:MAG TPA: hypothetical protein VI790_03510 [Candidatus Nanoarchaeia archaeon]|nr:hypothetical protein [Candidatus Nanoarchaeia archaeon]
MEFNKLLKKGLSKGSVKHDLIMLMIALEKIEERARNTYEEILKNNADELSNENKNVINTIKRDEESHMAIADRLLKIISDYDFDMELVVFKLH